MLLRQVGGTVMNGIVPLWKPAGITSHDCVIKLRRYFSTKKVGHTGTLDPEVEGILPICVGEATKIVPYLTNTTKTYQAEVTLGVSTDTEDQTGMPTEQIKIDRLITESEVKETLVKFQGEITQLTPLYSAVKVKGKKLYEYARANQPVERPVRHVFIHAINYLEKTLNQSNGKVSFGFEATVSKGTYIRTLAVDIGKALGFPAHMSHLVRTATASFDRSHAVTLTEIEQLSKVNQLTTVLLPIEAGLMHLPTFEVDQQWATKVLTGQKFNRPNGWQEDQPYVMMFSGKVLAIYYVHPTKPELIKPLRVFKQ